MAGTVTSTQAARAQAAGEAAIAGLWEDEDGPHCDACLVRAVLEAAAPILLEELDNR